MCLFLKARHLTDSPYFPNHENDLKINREDYYMN